MAATIDEAEQPCLSCRSSLQRTNYRFFADDGPAGTPEIRGQGEFPCVV